MTFRTLSLSIADKHEQLPRQSPSRYPPGIINHETDIWLLYRSHDQALARTGKSITASDVIKAITELDFGPADSLVPLLEIELAGKLPALVQAVSILKRSFYLPVDYPCPRCRSFVSRRLLSPAVLTCSTGITAYRKTVQSTKAQKQASKAAGAAKAKRRKSLAGAEDAEMGEAGEGVESVVGEDEADENQEIEDIDRREEMAHDANGTNGMDEENT